MKNLFILFLFFVSNVFAVNLSYTHYGTSIITLDASSCSSMPDISLNDTYDYFDISTSSTVVNNTCSDVRNNVDFIYFDNFSKVSASIAVKNVSQGCNDTVDQWGDVVVGSMTYTKDVIYSCTLECLKSSSDCPVVNGVQQVVNPDTCLCETPCSPPDNALITNLSASECVGHYKDFNLMQEGDLSYSICDDNICYMLNPVPLVSACDANQILDANGTCVNLTLPSAFPNSDDKGIASIRDLNGYTPETCVSGSVLSTGIAYGEILGFDYEKNICKVGVFFCNNGLTWDSLDGTCKVPQDNLSFDPNNNEISQELADACLSGNWAKRWTLDYCGQPLCYISLADQNYNLSCGNKYLEYACTSDYRIKKYVQVSCGEVSQDDFDTTTLEIGDPADGSTGGDTNISVNDTNDYLPDLNSTVENLDIVSAINSGSGMITSSISSLGDSIDGMRGDLSGIDGKLSGIDGKLDEINDALHTGDDQIGELDNFSGSFDLFLDDVMNSYNTVQNQFNETSNLINSGFTYSPPTDGCVDPSTVVYGSQIDFNLCEPLSKFSPFVYFITTIGFTIIAIKIIILGLAI